MNHPMTIRALWIAIVSTMTLGCGQPASSDLPTLTMQLADQLKTVKDEPSAKAARPKLEAIANQINAIQVEIQKGKAAMPADIEQFARRQKKAMSAYNAEVSRISNIPAAAQQLEGTIQELKH